MADSVHEWGGWDTTPKFESRPTFNFTAPTFVATAEQTRVGTNSGDLVAATPSNTEFKYNWVGYALETNSVKFDDNQGISPDSHTPVATDFKIFLQNSGQVSEENDFFYKVKGSIAVQGTFNDKAFNLNETTLFDQKGKPPYVNLHGANFASTETDSAFLVIVNYNYNDKQEDLSAHYILISNPISNSAGVGEIYDINKGTGAVGLIIVGKPMSLDAIKAAASFNEGIYQLQGSSFLNSNVSLSLNLVKGNWTGEWSGSKYYDKFSAVGTITGNTLSSTRVSGRLPNDTEISPIAPIVKSGSVTATIVPNETNTIRNDVAINRLGVIGKTVLNVVDTNNIKSKVGDVFQAGFNFKD